MSGEREVNTGNVPSWEVKVLVSADVLDETSVQGALLGTASRYPGPSPLLLVDNASSVQIAPNSSVMNSNVKAGLKEVCAVPSHDFGLQVVPM